MPDFVEISVFDYIASYLCVSESFDVLISILLKEVKNLSAFSEKIVLDHACKVDRTGE